MENFHRKERVNVDAYTIEHVLPQNPDLSVEWQRELGPNWKEVQDKYLHTIGNLTLTGYNAELSDRSFAQKRAIEGGFQQSPLRLNEDLAHLEHWNEGEIRRRGERLADRILEIWPAPTLPTEVLETYRKTIVRAQGYTLDDHEALRGAIRPLFEAFRKRVLNLDAGVHEQVRKLYIAYTLASNFVEVVPQNNELKLFLDIPIAELSDPRGFGRDVTNVGHWGTGDVEVRLRMDDELDYVMELVHQAFERQGEDGYGETGWSRPGVERVIEQAADPAAQGALFSPCWLRCTKSALSSAVDKVINVRATYESEQRSIYRDAS